MWIVRFLAAQCGPIWGLDEQFFLTQMKDGPCLAALVAILVLAPASVASAQQRPQDLAAAAAERAFTESRARWATGSSSG